MINSIAYAKLILFGEHAVVYGEPAIAVPLKEFSTIISIQDSKHITYSTDQVLSTVQKKNLRRLITDISDYFNIKTFDLKIESSIPISSGYGSSASLSIALIRAFSEYSNKNISNAKINELAYRCEKIFHGTPSGIDNTVICYEKPVLFQDSKPNNLDLKNPIKLYIVESKKTASTKDVVMAVRKNFEAKKAIISKIGSLVMKAKDELILGNYEKLGELMTKNHVLLKELGVSDERLDFFVDAAIKSGAYGAKLSGKGMGGCVIILAPDNVKFPFETRTVVIE